MNTLLRIQVKVLAKEANAALRSITNAIKTLQNTMAKGNMGGGAQMAGLTRQLKGVQTQVNATGQSIKAFKTQAASGSHLTALGRLSQRVSGEMNRTRMGIIAMGKDLQWVGRQINFNFTLPLVYAGSQAMKLVLNTERAFTRLRKVYGDSGEDYRAELDKISQAMRLLSDYYGINQAEVMELAAQWAAAGATGAELAKAVEASINLSILGDYENLSETFEGLVQIQGAYHLSTTELAQAVAILNTVENKTAAQLPDLVTGIVRAGSAAETAGTDIRELAAMMAVLTPATGTAANAGNALKTIMSRLLSPTQETVDVLAELGIVWSDTFEAMTGTQKIQLLADKFTLLTDSQKSYVSAIIAGRWHVNKFDVLLEDMANRAGTFHSVMKLIDDDLDMKNLQAANKEIATLLESDPRKLEILTTMIKNLMADAIIPLLPVIIGLLTIIKQLFQWFSALPDPVQKAALGFLLFIAAIGVVAQMVGSVQLLFGTFLRFIIAIARTLPFIGLEAAGAAASVSASAATSTAAVGAQTAASTAAVSAQSTALTATVATAATAQTGVVATAATAQVGIMGRMVAAMGSIGASLFAVITSPWTLAIAAIVGLLYLFRKEIGDAIGPTIEYIKKGFNSLPQSVQNAMMAVVRVVAAAVNQIREWLSYLNPFARHSPSLVDNVTSGVDAILRQYQRLTGIGAAIQRSTEHLKAFAAATKDLMAQQKANERGEIRTKILTEAPSAGPSLNLLFADLDAFNAHLETVNMAIEEQEVVVARVKLQYEAAARAVDAFDLSMEPLRQSLDAIQNDLAAAESELDRFANAPLIGMQAMGDKIFENEMAQKRLRLEMLRMGEAGESFEDIQAKMAALNGDIEFLRAEMAGLQSGGAGSDITSVYDEQIRGLEAQKDALTGQAQAGLDLQQQLEDLQRAGEILDLENALQFDPLIRQIEQLANTTEELSFEEIVAGITAQRQRVDELTTAYDANKAALDEQQGVLDSMILARDALKVSYENEQAQLDALKQTYSEIEEQIRAIEEALNSSVQAHDALAAANASPFGDLEGEFDTPPLPAFGEELNLDALIKEWEDRLKNSFQIDIFGWIKEKWGEFKDWWSTTLVPELGGLWELITSNPTVQAAADWVGTFATAVFEAVSNIDWSGTVESIGNGFTSAWNQIPFHEQMADAFSFLIEELPGWFSDAWGHIQEFGENIGGALAEWAELGAPAVEAFEHIKNGVIDALKLLRIALAPMIAGIVLAFTVGWNILKNVVGPIFDWIGKMIAATLDVIRNTIKLILAIINGDWSAAWDAIKGIVTGIWNQIVATVQMAFEVILGIFEGLKETALGLFDWASSVGVDIISGIISGLADAAMGVFNWFKDFVNMMIDSFKSLLGISSPSTVFMDLGIDIMQGLLEGLIEGVVAVAGWFIDLGANVLGWVGDVATWLWQKGRDFMGGLLGGLFEKAVEVTNWLLGLPGRLASAVGDMTLSLLQKGRDLIAGLWHGAGEVFDIVKTWLFNLPSNILNAMPDLGQTLLSAGADLVNGFKEGIKGAWNGLANWWNNHIGNWSFSIPGFDPPGPGPSFDGFTFNVPNMPTFHQGGIVPGAAGMDVPSIMRAGEMALTSTQQRRLLSLADGAPAMQAASTTESKTFIFNGDLEFPNIKSGDDAETFVTNLEALAGSAA